MKRKFDILGAPFGFCANKAGSLEAPNSLREKGLNFKIRCRSSESWGESIDDLGNVEVSDEILNLIHHNDKNEALMLYSQQLSQRVFNSLSNGHMPIVIGGDHSITLGTIIGTMKYLESTGRKKGVGVIWVDAHADLNDRITGNLHGKSAAILLGHVFNELLEAHKLLMPLNIENILYIGLRDVMPNELKIIQDHQIKIYDMESIDELGVKQVIKEAISRLEDSSDGIFLTFDIDACDGGIYRGCGTPEVGGLSSREAITLVSEAMKSDKLMGIDFVEYSPEDDVLGNTGELLIKLIDVVFGYRY